MTNTQKQNILYLDSLLYQAIEHKKANARYSAKMYNNKQSNNCYAIAEFNSRENYNEIIKKAKKKFLSLDKQEKDVIVRYYTLKIQNLKANENLGIIRVGQSKILIDLLLDIGVVNDVTVPKFTKKK